MPTEVEKLLVKLSGDDTGYSQVMERATKASTRFAKKVTSDVKESQRLVKSMLNAVSNEWIKSMTPMQRYEAQLSGLWRMYREGIMTLRTYNRLANALNNPMERENKQQWKNFANALGTAAKAAGREQAAAAKQSSAGWKNFANALRVVASETSKQQSQAAKAAAAAWKNFAKGLQVVAQQTLQQQTQATNQANAMWRNFAKGVGVAGAAAQKQSNTMWSNFGKGLGAAAQGQMQANTRTMQLANRLWQQSLTPMQRHRQLIGQINALYRSGYLTVQAYQQMVRHANGQMLGRIGGNILSFLGGMGSSVGMLAGGPGGMAMALGMMVAKVKELIMEFGRLAVRGGIAAVKLAADFELVQISFRVLLKDAATADKILNDIRQFANATPFLFPELAEASKALSAYGIEAQQILPTLKMLGELSAGMNIPMEELTKLYGRNRAQMRLYQRDLNEFQGRGIPILEEFQKMFGKSAAEIRKMTERGELNFGHLQKALIALTTGTGRFAGLTDELSRTFIGRWSTMKDAVLEFGRTVGKGIMEGGGLKQDLEDVIGFMTILNGFFTENKDAARLYFHYLRQDIGAVAAGIGMAISPATVQMFLQARDSIRMATEAMKNWEKIKKEAGERDLKAFNTAQGALQAERINLEALLAKEKNIAKQNEILEKFKDLTKREEALEAERERLKSLQVIPDEDTSGKIAMKELQDQMKGIDKDEDKAAKKIHEDNRTAMETYADAIRDLNLLLIKGKVTQEDYNRERARLLEVMWGDKVKEETAAVTEQQKALEDLTKELELQIALGDKKGAQAEVEKLRRQGMKEEDLKAVQDMADQLDLKEKLRKEEEELERLKEKHLSPQEKYNKKVEELDKLWKAGKIGLQEYNGELKEAAEALDRVGRSAQRLDENGSWIAAWKRMRGLDGKPGAGLPFKKDAGPEFVPGKGDLKRINKMFKPDMFDMKPDINMPVMMAPMPMISGDAGVIKMPMLGEEILDVNEEGVKLLKTIAENTSESTSIEVRAADFEN